MIFKVPCNLWILCIPYAFYEYFMIFFSLSTVWGMLYNYLQCGECCIKLFFPSNVNIFLDGAAALLISICQASSCTSSCSRLMPCCWLFKALLMGGTSSTLKSSTPHKSRCANGTEKWLWSRLSVVEPELVPMSYVHDWCHHLTTQVRIHLTNLRMCFFFMVTCAKQMGLYGWVLMEQKWTDSLQNCSW